MVIWETLNALMNWMNAYGINDYASLTIIMMVGAIVYHKVVEPIAMKLWAIAKEAISDWKIGRQLRKSKEAAR